MQNVWRVFATFVIALFTLVHIYPADIRKTKNGFA